MSLCTSVLCFNSFWCGSSSPCSTPLLRPGCAEPAHPSIHLVATAPHQPLTSPGWFTWCHHFERWTRLDSGSPIPPQQQGLSPVFSIGFFVERQLGWSSERTRLCPLDSPQLGHSGSLSVVVQRRWQHLFFTVLMAHEAFYQNGNQAHFFILLRFQTRRKKKGALQR